MAAKKHVHKYYFGLDIAGTPVWACALPDCNHYMPKHMEGLVNHRFGLCWKCGDRTQIDFADIPKFQKLAGPEGKTKFKVYCYDCSLLLTHAMPEERPMVESKPASGEPITQYTQSVVEATKCEVSECHNTRMDGSKWCRPHYEARMRVIGDMGVMD